MTQNMLSRYEEGLTQTFISTWSPVGEDFDLFPRKVRVSLKLTNEHEKWVYSQN